MLVSFQSGVSIPDFNKKLKKNGQNPHKFKILYIRLIPRTSAIWQHMLHIPPTKIFISSPLKKTKQDPHERAYLSELGGLGKNEVRKMGQKQKQIRQKQRQDYD